MNIKVGNKVKLLVDGPCPFYKDAGKAGDVIECIGIQIISHGTCCEFLVPVYSRPTLRVVECIQTATITADDPTYFLSHIIKVHKNTKTTIQRLKEKGELA